MRRSNKGHRDGAVQAAFETAPRVWVLCVKNAFLFAGRVMILGGCFFSPGTSLPRHAQEQSLFVRPRETNRSRKYGFVSGSGMRLTDSGAQDFDRFMSGVHVGLVGFEPTASWSRTRRSTKLSHSPKWNTHFRVRDGRATYFAYFSADSKEIESVVRGPVFETIGILHT